MIFVVPLRYLLRCEIYGWIVYYKTLMTQREWVYESSLALILLINSKLFIYLVLLEICVNNNLIRSIIVDLLLSSLRLVRLIKVVGEIIIKFIHQENILNKKWCLFDTKSLHIIKMSFVQIHDKQSFDFIWYLNILNLNLYCLNVKAEILWYCACGSQILIMLILLYMIQN